MMTDEYKRSGKRTEQLSDWLRLVGKIVKNSHGIYTSTKNSKEQHSYYDI